MKKIIIMILAVFSALLMFGCTEPDDPDRKEPVDPVGDNSAIYKQYLDKFDYLLQVETINETISIKSNNIEGYLLSKKYTRNGEGFDFTSTEKRLNKVPSESTDAYTENTENGRVDAAETFMPSLKLKDEYFNSWKETEDGLELSVKSASVKDVLGLNESLPTVTDNMKIIIKADDLHITGFKMTYDSNAFSVEINITFTY